MNDSARILVVDDDSQITRVLTTVLASQGYATRAAPDGVAAHAIVAEWQPDLVLTDLGMPRMNGLDLCRRIRILTTAPIIVLSVKDAERAKVEALDAGADDYITKPFGTDELLARVRAALRRSAPDEETNAAPIDIGDFRIDVLARRVYVRGRAVRLTPKEFDLFVYLARRPNRVIERRRLLEAVWGEMAEDHPEYLRVFMGQLRKKIERNPSTPQHLATEPWVGYRFNP
ncbi:MAG: DNA-binding response regulator [Acidobacteria bacterium]|nr:MAG: DNA-binding response regulator [Acidobacteriota bacterium]